MPKIIEDLKNTILNEAKRQVMENGYSNTTIRSVAKGAGIAVGTIYNYYTSKDVLIASFMLTDWLAALAKMRAGCEQAKGPMEACSCICEGLQEFYQLYSPLFQDAEAQKSFDGVFHERHRQLRTQLSELLQSVCMKYARKPSGFLPEFIAEALLVWTAEEQPFDGENRQEASQTKQNLLSILEQFFI